MERIEFDSGVQEYQLGEAGVLRFNPADPNVYARFLEAAEDMQQLQQELTDEADREEAEPVALLARADKKLKGILSEVFGPENDFEKILRGVSLFAVTGNGQTVAQNLFAALEPVLVEGAEACAGQKVDSAVQKARDRRAAQK